MSKKRVRPTYYLTVALRDGTVIATYPIRRPAPRILKRDGASVDEDGVIYERATSGREYASAAVENRFRFQDIMATNLNTRRAIRGLLIGPIGELRAEVAKVRRELAELRAALLESGGRDADH